MSSVKDAQWVAQVFEPLHRELKALAVTEPAQKQQVGNIQRRLEELARLVKERIHHARTTH